jgi:hypothetical protein
MIDKRNWKDTNCDRNQINVNEKENLENLDENLDEDLENANLMNTKLVNLHVIFFFDLILNCFVDKHLKIKHYSSFSKIWLERRRNRKRRRNEQKEFANSLFNRWHHDFLFSFVHFVIFIAINVTLINEFFIIRAQSASRRKWVNSTNHFRFFAIFTRDDNDSFLDTNLDRCCVMSLFFLNILSD